MAIENISKFFLISYKVRVNSKKQGKQGFSKTLEISNFSTLAKRVLILLFLISIFYLKRQKKCLNTQTHSKKEHGNPENFEGGNC